MKSKDKSENFTEKTFKSPIKMDVKLDLKDVRNELSETKSKDGTLTEVMMTHKVSLGTESKAGERTNKHEESDDEKFDEKNIKSLGNKYVQFLTPLEYTPKAGGKSYVLPDGESTKNSTKAQHKVSSLMTRVSTDVNHQGMYNVRMLGSEEREMLPFKNLSLFSIFYREYFKGQCRGPN